MKITLKEWFESDAHSIAERIYKMNGRWAWTDYVSGLRGPDDEALHVYKAVFVSFIRGGRGDWLSASDTIEGILTAPSQYAEFLVRDRSVLKKNLHFARHIYTALRALEDVADPIFRNAVRQLVDAYEILISGESDEEAKVKVHDRLLNLKSILERNLFDREEELK